MTCFCPITGWRSAHGKTPDGKWPVVFNISEGLRDFEVKVPCGQCIGCRLDKSLDWAGRCIQESTLWEHNYFLTLTYDDERTPVKSFQDPTFCYRTDRPDDGGLIPLHLTLFWKRLRKSVFAPLNSEDLLAGGLGRLPIYEFVDGKRTLVNSIRYFACGEYGDKGGRPHYHAIVFNLDIPDKIYYGMGSDGSPMFRSNWLERIWGHGNVIIGSVTPESAGYVARYTTKKIYGDPAADYYGTRLPPFSRCSNRPGIGFNWFIKNREDIERLGFVLINGKKHSVPRYYLDKLFKLNKQAYFDYKAKRAIIAKKAENSLDNEQSRLIARREAKEYTAKALKRTFE